MARIRSIHPGLWTDEAFISVTVKSRLLFIGLLNECDDQGAFRWNPVTLKVRLAPMDTTDVPALLSELARVNLIRRYQVDGKTYGAVRNFREWQRPKKPTAVYPMTDDLRSYAGPKSEGSEPTPDEAWENGELWHDEPVGSGELIQLKQATVPPDRPSTSEPTKVKQPPVPPDSASGGEKSPQGGEGRSRREGKEESSLRSESFLDEHEFDGFWAAYPRKDDKGHARKAYTAARRKAQAAAILAGLQRYQFSPDPKFRPLAATWLNGERWLAEVTKLAPETRAMTGGF